MIDVMRPLRQLIMIRGLEGTPLQDLVEEVQIQRMTVTQQFNKPHRSQYQFAIVTEFYYYMQKVVQLKHIPLARRQPGPGCKHLGTGLKPNRPTSPKT